MKKIPVVMKTWAGSEPHDMDYITQSVPSLLASHMPDNVEFVIYDDCSPSDDLRRYLRDTAKRDPRVRLIFGETNKGPNRGQEEIYQMVASEYAQAPHFINVDDDVVYHPNWYQQLTEAENLCQQFGLTGVFTALNMPYRQPHATLSCGGRTLLLKWKQPALNWLIPKALYDDVGPFRDEGIAYDTVYSHWMRLKQYPVICMSPSFVQNIGLLGAYAVDDTTTSLDFVGTSQGSRAVHALRFRLRRAPDFVRTKIDGAAKPVSPIRWGTEFVHEAVDAAGNALALFTLTDYQRLGWQKPAIAARAAELAKTPSIESVRVLGPRFNRKGDPVQIESNWKFMANLHELGALNLLQIPWSGEAVFRSLLDQLAPLHANHVIHNKVRRDNVYWDPQVQRHVLAWLGTEPCPALPLGQQSDTEILAVLSGALNRWATLKTRQMFAIRYIETQSPEVMSGQSASVASDLFSAAAIAVLGTSTAMARLEDVRTMHENWARGNFGNAASTMSPSLLNALRRCLQADPADRPLSAEAVLTMLNS